MKINRNLIAFFTWLLVVATAVVGYAIVVVSGTGTNSSVVVSPEYSASGSGGFTFNSSAGTQGYYLSSGTNAATSVPCNQVTLSLAGTGVISTTGGTASQSGIYYATAGTTTYAAPISFPIGNLNALQIVGTGQIGYIYTK
jgi:hypothetical protein